ncbi:E3 ubiquitin-protein ligase RBBP6 isoform X2 [Daktulosphaira vitifoliae]|uniref:E3 ubiquitin-protein ligase RBBP6 isoform X2 n=1 Tax=Daktulosphaira vitifoliae TaxID=58002 RepID=UPI0021A978FA|nr:E3 ubiquitin-protein ligase RBBP6 isoform X2 [Daktulosphaira vitifoliae]
MKIMSVHYKFKSAISYDTITFDGLHISLKDLKKAILHQKQIGKNTDFDLQVTNAQTNEEYTDDQTLIPKNTSLVVSRIPLTAQQKKAWERAEQNNQLVLSKQISNLDSHDVDTSKLKGADLLGSNASEEDKINAMMAQSTQEYDPSNFVKIRGGNQFGEVPSNYVCHRCHNPGHWIKNCPNNNITSEPMDIKKATGIPRGFLVPVDGPSVPGAMLTGLGTFAVPSIDQEAYKESMKPHKKQETEVEKVMIPEDLLCSLCSDLLNDADMMPCCGTSFCDECIRNALLESEENECPDCHGKEISPETLIPNRYLRNAVNSFKDKTGYSNKRMDGIKGKINELKSEIVPTPVIQEEQIKEEVVIPASTQLPTFDPSIEGDTNEIYQKISAVGDSVSVEKNRHKNYSSTGTRHNSHNHTFKSQVQSQAQSQASSVSGNISDRPNNTNILLPTNNMYQNARHPISKSSERMSHVPRYNPQSMSIPPHPHLRPCLPVGPADLTVPPPPFAHPPPNIQSDVGYNQMQPILNPPPPGLDQNNSPANVSSDEGMLPLESSHHQLDKFENTTGSIQSVMRNDFSSSYYQPMPGYEQYPMHVDMRNRGYSRGYRRPSRGQHLGSSYRNGGSYVGGKRTIDDPLAMFQRILRERDNKRRDLRGRHSLSRSRSRSISRSRSRDRSRSLSRSPARIMKRRTRSISRSPPPRNRSISPRRRSRTRSRSPMRKRKKSLTPLKRVPVKSRRRSRSSSRDQPSRRSRSLSIHRRSRTRSRSPVHRNRLSPSPRFRSRSPSFYSSPTKYSNYPREEDNYGAKANWRGRGGSWNRGNQPYHQTHRYQRSFEEHTGQFDVALDRSDDYVASYPQFDPHYAMDPNLVCDWDEIRDKEMREREKEKKEEEEKQNAKSKSRTPVKYHKVDKQNFSPEKNHKDSDKKDKGKKKKKKDTDVDKKKKKKSKEKKDKEDGKKSEDKEVDDQIGSNKNHEINLMLEDQEPAAPGTSESPPPFEIVSKESNSEEKMSDGLYGDLGEEATVDTSWGSYTQSLEETTSTPSKLDTKQESSKEPEVLAELPERSKWEVEDETNIADDKIFEEKIKEKSITDTIGTNIDINHRSVTNEVLKRAENAIFQKTIRTLDGKKIVMSDNTKDKKTDTVKEKKSESEKYNKEKKTDNSSRDKKLDTTKDKKTDSNKDKKIEVSKEKKMENVINKDNKKQDMEKEKKIDKNKRSDIIEKKSGVLNKENKSKSSLVSQRDSSKHRDKKESDNVLDSLTIQREARKAGNSIQITIPTDTVDDKKVKEIPAKRISAKDRLGEKIEDKDDKRYKSSRSEKRRASRSPIRVHSTLIVPEPLSRKVRGSSKSRRDDVSRVRRDKSSGRISHRHPSRYDDEKKLENSRKIEESRKVVNRADNKHHRTTGSEHPRSSPLVKKDDRSTRVKEEKRSVKEEKLDRTVKRKAKSIGKESPPEKKERRNRRLESDRNNDEQEDEEDEVIKNPIKNNESDESNDSSSSSSSSSSDSSPVRTKKRKKNKKQKKKKHVKKKKVVVSSSDSDYSDSSSESEEESTKQKKKKKKEQRSKHKTHKKSIKKKKKSKHK